MTASLPFPKTYFKSSSFVTEPKKNDNLFAWAAPTICDTRWRDGGSAPGASGGAEQKLIASFISEGFKIRFSVKFEIYTFRFGFLNANDMV